MGYGLSVAYYANASEILAVGQAFTFAAGAPWEACFPAQLA